MFVRLSSVGQQVSRRWLSAGVAAVLTAATLAVVTGSASPASATAPLATTATTTTIAEATQSTPLAGLSVSGDTGSYDANVTVATTHGTLSMTATSGVTLAYPSTLSGGASITMGGSVSDVNAALATMHLDGTAADSGTDAVITISMTLGVAGAVWSPTNHHFYEFVPATGMTWNAARTDAATKTLLGYTGYLASIPSAAVNTLIASKVQNNVWIGAASTDNPSGNPARSWHWVAGPLANTVFTNCSNFLNSCNVTSTNGQYTSWQTFEPNNSGGVAGQAYSGEWVGLTNYGAPGKWNDFSAGHTDLAGYIVEFGNSADGTGDFTGMSSTPVSSSSTVHFNGPPSAPVNVVATPHNANAAVSWTTPATNGHAITSYTVTVYDPMSGDAVVTTQTCSSSPCTVTGLTNGSPYHFGVYATNSIGDSPEADSGIIMIGDVPDPPTAATATAGDTLANVSWTNPTNDGGINILSYNVTASPGGAVTNCYGSPCEIDSLTNGTAYTFTVQAVNAAGSSSSSASSAITNSVTPSGLPNPPNTVEGVAGTRGTAVITFSGADGNGANITGYKAVDNIGTEHSCASSPCTVTGLTNGVNYYFTIRSVNTNGESSDSYPTNYILVGELPGAPTNVSAAAGDGQADVSFTAPSDNGGASIDGYTVTSQPDGLTADCTTSPCTVTGLTDGTAYTFTVVTHTAVGTSVPSAASASVTPATLPNAPSGFTFTPGNGGGVAAIARSNYDGGAPITEYVVNDSDGGLHHCSAAGSSDPLSCTLTGMTNGHTVNFTVYATNAAGDSPSYYDPSSYVVGAVPNAPTNVVAAPGNSQVSLSFTAPSGNGLAITDYIATDNNGTTYDCSSASSPCVVTGLNNGVPYTFTIHAVNAAGDSPESATTATVTPNIPGNPDAPTGVSAVAGDGQATVSFTAPVNTGGSSITGYTATSDPGGLTASCLGSPCIVTGLTNGTAYTFTVHATNGSGDSGESPASSSVTPAAVPDAPTSVSAVAGDGTASVTFTAPVNDNGASITGYTATSSPGNHTATCITSPCSVTGLSNGTSYTFTVHATNTVGDSAESAASSGVTPLAAPSSPTAVSAVAGAGSAVVSFTAPTSNGGSSITGYTVVTHPGSASASCSSSPCTITGLTNGSVYTFTVIATNIAGDSPASAASTAVTPATTPGVPTSVAAVAGNHSATVTFTAPSNGGSAITGYTITTHPGSATTSCSSSPCTVTGLTNGSAYTFSVHATNTVGDSTESSASGSVTPVAAPSTPTGVTVSPGNGAVNVSFTESTDNGGHVITGYVVIASPGNHQMICAGPPCYLSGLTNGTAYTVTVAARTSVADSAPTSPTPAVTPATNPGAPTSVSATRGDHSAVVSFSAPASNGGSAITDYVVTTHPGSTTTDCPNLLCTVTGLTNGQTYTFTAHATNGVGDSTESAASSSVVPATAPGAPTAVTAAAGDSTATVSFTAPGNDGGSTITGYTVTTHPGGGTASCSSSPCTVVGLTNGTAYTFTVFATNDVGDSADSAASSAITPASVPGAPTGVTASRGNSSAVVSFDAPTSDGGSTITDYIVTTHPGGTTTSCLNRLCTITGLTNGTAYTFTVHAVNGAGDSAESAASSAVTPATTPGRPTGVSATGDNGSAEVSFTAPVDDGSSVITGYTITTHPGSATTSCNSSPCTVSGLTNGTAYTFTVAATNGVGDSQDSIASAPVTPATTPDAPTAVSASAGNGAADITFSAPLDDGGSAITGYHVITHPGGASTTCNASPCTVTGLTNGTAYTFTVVASNVLGDSPASAATASVTPATTPGVPTNVSATAGNASATVTFTAPSTVGGLVITGYTVTTQPGGATTSCNASPCTVTGLTNGTAYTFTVHATNGVGDSPESSTTSAVTPAVAPGVPTGVSVTSGNGAVTVSFTAPTDSGGHPITGYVAIASPGNHQVICSTSPCTITGLTNGTAYTVTVAARTSFADSAPTAPSAAVIPATMPGVPTGVTAARGDQSAVVSFVAPASDGGSAITDYLVTTHPGGATTSCTTSPCTVSGLTNGTSYTFSVHATNGVGDSVESGSSTAVVPAVVPDAPTGVQGSIGNGHVTLTFTAPANTGGLAITGYTVTASPGGATTSCAQSPCLVTGLTNGTDYTFTVHATNAVGDSAESSVSSVLTPLAAPGIPTGVSVDAGDGQATAHFTAPTDNGGATITSYQVSLDGGSTWSTVTVDVNGTARTTVLTALTNGTTYHLEIRAVNIIGHGQPTAAVAFTPVTPPPAAVGAPAAVAGVASVDLSWPLSTAAGVTGYTVTASPGPATCVTTSVSSTECTIGAMAGVSYTYRVVVHSAFGDSTASAASNVVTPMAPPVPSSAGTAPTTLTTTDGQIASIDPGQQVIVVGTGFASYSTATVVIYSSPIVLGTIRTRVDGTFRLPVTIPARLPVGHHNLLATGVNPAGETHTMRLPVTLALAGLATVAAPRHLKARSAGSSIKVSFDRVTPPSGTTIARYEVSTDGGRTWRTARATGSPTAHAVITGLARGKTYRVAVRAVGKAGRTTKTGRSSLTVRVRLARAARPWFHDPLTAAQRRHEIAVPKHPGSYHGSRRATVATDRSHNGSVAVPVAWARGHRLTAHQAVTMGGAGMFAFDSAKLTAHGRTQLRMLAAALKGARAIVCEGYSDYGGAAAHQQSLSVARAKAVCSYLKGRGVHARMSTVGYGGSRPVVLALKPGQRAANRRVVVFVKR